jgi:hypothetical protein
MKWETDDLFGDKTPSGADLRDEGIARVSEHNLNWLDACVSEVRLFRFMHVTFTGEDIRFHCTQRVGHPAHHNAWGALTNVCIRRDIIRPTGEHRPMRDPISHARQTPVYTRGEG